MGIFKRKEPIEAIITRLESEMNADRAAITVIKSEIEKADYRLVIGDSSAQIERDDLSAKLTALESNLKRKENALTHAKLERSEEIKALTASKEREAWASVDSAFPEMVKLAKEIEAEQAKVCEKVKALNQKALKTFELIPKKDITLYYDSPLGPQWIEGHYRLLLRKLGMNWAREWLDSPTRIPSLVDHLKDSHQWAMKMNPQINSGRKK